MKLKIAVVLSALLSAPVMAGVPNSVVLLPAQPVPILSQAGLIALAFALGLAGAYLIRKNKAQ